MLSPGFLVRHSAILLFRLVTLALLCFAYIVISLSLTVEASSTAKNTHSSKLIAQTLQSDCPDILPLPSKAPPSLNFCSPIYNGNVEGPYGSRIILVGKNFSSMPEAWLLTTNQAFDLAALPNCVSHSNSACETLPVPQTETITSSVTLFSWLWYGSAFPSSKTNYSFVAVFGTTIVETSPIQPHSLNVAFSLLSSRPPCITINNSNTSTCNQKQSIALYAGTTFTIDGSNWLPGDAQSVVVNATCALAHCHLKPLFQDILQPNTTGTFHKQITVPTGIIGQYTICATNQVQTSFTPGTDINTVANGSLTFGCPTNTTSLLLTVSPSPPSPSFQLSIVDVFSLILMVPALLALLLYFVVGRSSMPVTLAAKKDISASLSPADANIDKSISQASFTSSQPPVSLLQQQGVIMQGTTQTTYLLTKVFLQPLTTTKNAPIQIQELSKQDQQDLDKVPQKLAKGDLKDVIQLAKRALVTNLTVWDKLRWAIAEVPPNNYSPQFEQKAFDALFDALSRPTNEKIIIEQCSSALVYYLWNIERWRLDKSTNGTLHTADIRYNMGIAYSILAVVTPLQVAQAHALSALSCFQIALDVYQRNNHVLAQASTWHNIGNVHFNTRLLVGIDKTAAEECAITLYEKFLQIFDLTRSPEVLNVWIETNYHLGKAFSALALSSNERFANLKKAHQHYQAAYNMCNPQYFPTKLDQIRSDLVLVTNELNSIQKKASGQLK